MTKWQGSRSQLKGCLSIKSLHKDAEGITAHNKGQPTQNTNLIIHPSERVTFKAQNESWVYLSDEWH